MSVLTLKSNHRGIHQLLFIMKLTTVILLVGYLHVSAASYSQTITLDVKEHSLKDVFKTIQNQTDYKIIYNVRFLERTRPVTVSAKQMPLEDFLTTVLSEQALTYDIREKTIFIGRVRPRQVVEPVPEPQNLRQERIVTGKVTDESGNPLEGVTISVKGTSTAVTTGVEGTYRISIPENGNTLVFSIVGYGAVEQTLGIQNTVDVSLNAAVSDLDEVVVVGYGSQKKINLTGAVSTVNFEGVLENRPITNASQALGGTVSGLWVSQNTGRPGSDGAQIRVRGWGTLNNSNPLVLIDGVEGEMSQVNPSDIESITVLKDAASSAIYGSRAANGVVLITLKSGKFGDKVNVSFNSYGGVQELGRKYDLVDNSAEYMRLYNSALVNQQGSPLFPNELIQSFENGTDSYQYPNTNFFDHVFKKSAIHEHNLSINGGSESTKYYMSLNYLDQEGIILGTNSNRYGLTANLESKINNWLSMGGRINGIKRASNEPYDFNRILYIFANGGYPFTAPYTQDGRFGSVQALGSNDNLLVDQRNPLIETANGNSLTENNFLRMNAYLNVHLTSSLSLNTNFTSQYTNLLTDRFNEIIYGYTYSGAETANLNYPMILEANRDMVQTNYQTLFSTLNFNKRLADIHEISAVAGLQLENTTIKNLFGRRTDPAIAGLTQVDAGTNGIVAEGNKNMLRMFSYFGRINYSLMDKYLLEVNLRADASSRFRKDKRWGVFPAFSAGWRISEENFMKNQEVFSNLKVRASWGQLGNQNIGSYWPYLTVINQSNDLSYNFGNTFMPGAGVTDLVEENVSWETSTSLDIGIDASFLNNRISLEMDYFDKKTSDIIVQLPIPQVLGGLTAPFENRGRMSNRGFEATINYTQPHIERNRFNYSLGVNFTYVKNQVTEFGESPDQLYLIREGYSYRSLYGFNAIGLYQSDEEAAEHMFANGYKPQAGEIKFDDINGDGRLDFQDKTVLGNTIPKLTYGINAGFNYKGFDLNILLQGTSGLHVYTRNEWTTPFGVSGGTITERWRDAWTSENTDTNIPAIRLNNNWDNQPSSFWASEISFLKLKNIQLGYAFDSRITKKLGLGRLYTYFNGQNLYSFVNKDYEGFDPERNTFDAGANFYPIPQIYTLGIQLNF